MTDDELFSTERSGLFAIAYRMLGSVAEADDVVQDVFERWLDVNRTDIVNPAAYLTTMTTRRSIDVLRSARHTREVYVGPWLPEPIRTEPSPVDLVELDESLRLGFLHLLEQLTPVERAVHLLHEVFDYSFAEIAPMVDKTAANCRQIASRARQRLVASRPAASSTRTERSDERLVIERLVSSVLGGDVDAIAGMLTADVRLVSDGGAAVRAARRPVVGRHKVSMFMANLGARFAEELDGDATMEYLRVNHQPAVLITSSGTPTNVFVFDVSDEGLAAVYAIRNPEKLRALSENGEGRRGTGHGVLR